MRRKNLRKYYRLFKNLHELEEKGAEFIHFHEVPLKWLHDKLTPAQFLVLSGILVGCTAGLAGVLLKAVVHYIQKFITQDYHLSYQMIFYFIFPIMGIVGTVAIVRYFFKGDSGEGIPSVLYEIARKSSIVRFSKTYSQLIQSGITVGFGGSAGLESPIAVTGAAIGSNYARIYQMNYKDRTLLLAAGAAAGIASAFDAPIAGVMFAVEMLLTGMAFSDFIPLIIAAVCGALLSNIILGNDLTLHFRLKEAFDYRNVPLYVLLGIISGLYCHYYAVIVGKIEDLLHKRIKKKFRIALFSGMVLGLLCFLFPPLFGEGYTSVKVLVDNGGATLMQTGIFSSLAGNKWMILAFVGLVGLLKVFATTFTISGGGNGGNFAPSLVAGAFVGYFFALVCQITGMDNVPLANFAIVGMAGAMSGILYVPLTSIFLIAEATGGYELFIPLMIVSTASYLIVRRFSPYSINVKKWVEEGKVFGRKTDQNLLSLLRARDIIEKDILTISPDASLRDLINLIKINKRNMFGVVNEDQELEGVVMLDDIRHIMFKEALYDSTAIRQLMKSPPAFVDVTEPMWKVMKKFDETNAWNLPVVSGKRFIGFISKSTLLQNYRKMLLTHSSGE